MLGRAYVWAHLAAGEAGVRHMLELFRQQVDDGLSFLGVTTPGELDPSFLEIGWTPPFDVGARPTGDVR